MASIRAGLAAGSCQAGQPGVASGCFSQGMELKASLPLVPSHRHRLDVAPDSHLPALSQNSVYNWEMSGSFLCTIHLLPAGWDTACSGWGWLSKTVKGNPVAFLQRKLIKLCLVSGTRGESPEQSSCCLCWARAGSHIPVESAI